MRAAAGRIPPYRPWATLFSRLVLFAACQALFALAFAISGHAYPWSESVRWWPVSATLANLINIGLLFGLTRAEGISMTALYNWNCGTWKRDSPLFIGPFVVLGPLALLPSSFLALGLRGNVNATTPCAARYLDSDLRAARFNRQALARTSHGRAVRRFGL